MSYRNDLEAERARADALERENEELRAKLADRSAPVSGLSTEEALTEMRRLSDAFRSVSADASDDLADRLWRQQRTENRQAVGLIVATAILSIAWLVIILAVH